VDYYNRICSNALQRIIFMMLENSMDWTRGIKFVKRRILRMKVGGPIVFW